MRRFVPFVLVLALTLAAACGGNDDDDGADAAAGDDTTEATESGDDAADDGGDDDGGDDDGGSVALVAECPPGSEVGSIALDQPAADADVTELPYGVQCLYSVEDPDAGVFGVVNIKIYTSDAGSSLEIFKDVLEDEEEVTDVAVGDEAWWSPGSTNLFVVLGDAGVEVLLSGLGEGDDAKAVAIALVAPAMG